MTHNIIAYLTSMIGFDTWPPFIVVYSLKKGGQVTKPIILVKYAIILCQGVTNI